MSRYPKTETELGTSPVSRLTVPLSESGNPGYGTIALLLSPIDDAPRGEDALKSRGTGIAPALLVTGKLIELTPNRNQELCRPNRPRIEELKKEEGAKMARKKRVLLRLYLSQPLDELRNNHARHEIGMGIFWVVLAMVCGGLGWVLLTILLKAA
jgi:hypothetical protein